MLKLLICDGDGTIGYPNPSPELRDLFESLPALGIRLAVASNESAKIVRARFESAKLQTPDFIVTRAEMGTPKPSPEYVKRIRDQAGVELNEIAYIGDSDATDILCAVNAHILPFAAYYSTAQSAKGMQYGIPVHFPKALKDYLSTFGQQHEPYFGWLFSTAERLAGNEIDIRSLIYDHNWFTDTLKRVLKDQEDIRIGSNNVSVRTLLLHYLVSQCYMAGLASGINWVTVYPGHITGSSNSLLDAFSNVVDQTFNKRHVPDLLVRHRDAPESKRQGAARNIIDQLNSIHVNPKYKAKIRGKRILVLDDFTTAGYSFETARLMLMRAGAKRVTCVAIAKYRASHVVATIERDWNPFGPVTFGPDMLKMTEHYAQVHSAADQYFRTKIWPIYSA